MGYTTCNICSHALTDPVSIERGVGPDCWAKLQAKVLEAEEHDTTNYIGPSHNGDVALTRKHDTRWVGIGKRLLVKHSPTGLEWGYNGSGPADLALNVLMLWTGDYQKALRWHQDYKRKFVAQVDFSGGVLSKERGLAWLEEQVRAAEIAENPTPPEPKAEQTVTPPKPADPPKGDAGEARTAPVSHGPSGVIAGRENASIDPVRKEARQRLVRLASLLLGAGDDDSADEAMRIAQLLK